MRIAHRTCRPRSVVAAAMMLLAAPAIAAEYEVKELNWGDGGAYVFEPSLLRIDRGDTIKFLASHPGHLAGSITGMIPDGAKHLNGRRDENYAYTFDVPGVYVIDCYLHRAQGMIALVVVGDDTSNLEAINNVPIFGEAKKRLEALIARVEKKQAAAP